MKIFTVSFFLKFIKFCAVGASGLIVDFGITYLLKEKLKVKKYLANAIGFTAAASSNYILNRIWTFNSKNPDVFNEYISFFVISIVGLGINTAILWFFHKKLKQSFYLSKLIATVIVTLWNFFANWLITFAN